MNAKLCKKLLEFCLIFPLTIDYAIATAQPAPREGPLQSFPNLSLERPGRGLIALRSLSAKKKGYLYFMYSATHQESTSRIFIEPEA